MENKIELVCPECNEKFNVDIFTSINVQMDKDMKNRVLSGKLFDMECAHCHSKIHIPYPVLYHDMEKKLLIQFTEEKELEPIKKILDHANVGEDYTVRIVDNERDWIEKILISDSGYDDRIMELYKLLVLSQYEDADNVNGLYYWNIQNFENPHYVMVLDEKESDKMHFMPFHEGVYKQVEEVFLSDIKQDYIVDASWAVSNTK